MIQICLWATSHNKPGSVSHWKLGRKRGTMEGPPKSWNLPPCRSQLAAVGQAVQAVQAVQNPGPLEYNLLPKTSPNYPYST
jgi:hypothetical protein